MTVCCASIVLPGCLQQIAVSTVGGMVDEGFEAFTSESDLEFAEQALPGNLKLLDVMLKNSPDDERLLRLASEGYASYALAFLEGKDDERARAFYLRSRDYGLRIMRNDGALARALDGSLEDLKGELVRRDKDDVPGAFWAAFGWGGYIQLSLTDPAALVDLPRAQALMEFVERVDSTYYFSGAHLFLGTLYGSRARMLGGDPEKSKAHFEAALRINRGAFLLTYLYYAKSYAVQTQNEALFEELLMKVRDTPVDVLPSYRLANTIAKKKAEQLLGKKSDLF
ncbi:MAG: TRAP transporter TatT component family protein [Bacteroidota bacterium]